MSITPLSAADKRYLADVRKAEAEDKPTAGIAFKRMSKADQVAFLRLHTSK